MAAMDDLRYPIGSWSYPQSISTAEQRRSWIGDIAGTPAALRAAVAGLTEAQLDTQYRPGGWTLRQVVHHLPDSHMNGYVRFKLALTEETPTVKPFDEARWAVLGDVARTPPETSVALLESLHSRWVCLLQSMTENEWMRRFHHPDVGTLRLEQYLAGFAWHGKHHVAHITSLRKRMGWQ